VTLVPLGKFRCTNRFRYIYKSIFQIGRIIQAGDGDPEIRIMYSDDVAYERTVLKLIEKVL
jgi:hypothetical protein